jgi:hypothetical protein
MSLGVACCRACQAAGQFGGVCGCGHGKFTLVDQAQQQGTLIDSLTPIVDCVRDIYTQLGARQYEVSLVWTQWTGGERGVGGENVVRTLQVLPTPLVGTLNALDRELQSIGIDEAGTLRVSEISPRFSEDLLIGKDLVVRTGDNLPVDMNFYWEIYFPRLDGFGLRRRFTPATAPNKDPTNFEWVVNLLKSSENRTRDGVPQ